MIKHIVMFRFLEEAEGATKKENLLKAKAILEALPEKISEIKYYEVGINELDSPNACDFSVVSAFDTWEDLDAYRVHPAHKEAVEFIGKVRGDAYSSDYEV